MTNISVYKAGEKTVWIPVSSRDPFKKARAFLPQPKSKTNLYQHGTKKYRSTAPRSPFWEALQTIQSNWIEGHTSYGWFASNGSALSASQGWVEILAGQLKTIEAEELTQRIEKAATGQGKKINSALIEK